MKVKTVWSKQHKQGTGVDVLSGTDEAEDSGSGQAV